MKNTAERYILVAVDEDPDTARDSLSELAELLKTAGGEAIEAVVQKLPHPDPGTYLGTGKVYEIGELAEETHADGVICDDELSPVQLKNLSDMLSCKILDRTMLILDIFAAHARTAEGKIQVEMAQLKYTQAHLRGIGKALSRLGGGIGTRGPGETKLETDRRAIMRRISVLSSEIKAMKGVRETTRKKRQESPLPTVAIVGYTNAGKSTLLNSLKKGMAFRPESTAGENAGNGIPGENAQPDVTGDSTYVLAEDKLFATLDPTTRVCRLQDGQEVLFTDTVGFINKLPHHLIDAFRSTLEEAKYADYILHVIDSADLEALTHMEVVYRTLHELSVTGKPVITVFNKCDLPGSDRLLYDSHASRSVRISAKEGTGMKELSEQLSGMIRENRVFVDTVLPYSDGGRLFRIRKYGQLLSEEYEADGVHITAFVPPFLTPKEDGLGE